MHLFGPADTGNLTWIQRVDTRDENVGAFRLDECDGPVAVGYRTDHDHSHPGDQTPHRVQPEWVLVENYRRLLSHFYFTPLAFWSPSQNADLPRSRRRT